MSDKAAGGSNLPPVHCSFCGKTQEQVRTVVSGPNAVFICDECVIISLGIISRTRLNLRAAYFAFELIARVLHPVTSLTERLRE